MNDSLGGGEHADAALENLVSLAERACASNSICVALSFWQDNPFAGLLPFHLHLRWPGRVRGLPLNASFAVVPRFDSELTGCRVYSVSESMSALQRARAARAKDATRGELLQPPDWAQGWHRRTDDQPDCLLSGNSFIAIDSINASNGRVKRGTRSVLGRHATRNAPRPSVLVPGVGEATPASLDAFVRPDLAVIDIQGVRGRRALDWTLGVIRARSARSSIVVASGPGDLLAPGILDALGDCAFSVIGAPPPTPSILVTIVGEDRPTLERAFEMAVEHRERAHPAAARLFAMATSAWWSQRQALAADAQPQPETDLFFKALDVATADTRDAAVALGAVAQILRSSLNAVETGRERLKATVTAALTGKGSGGVLILTRNWHACAIARHAIAAELRIDPGEIEALGVTVQTFRHRQLRTAPSVVVLAGYFGRDALECALRARPECLHFVLDPIEARALLFGLRDITTILNSIGATAARALLTSLTDAVQKHAPAFVEDAELTLRTNLNSHSPDELATNRTVPDPGDVLVALTDGTNLLVPKTARFDVIAKFGGSFRPRPAEGLRPGDRVVVLMEDAKRQFSDALLEALDRGVLAPLVQQRAMWLAIVSSVTRTTRIPVSTLMQRLRGEGHEPDAASVRGWTRFQNDADAAVPRHRGVFLALAKALEIQLPETDLENMFNSIRRLRTLHRKAGRDLVRAIRLARGGRLGAVSQAVAERQWGLDTSELMKAARIGIVDEVVVG